ncbi:MAG: UvrD-helicase domain-containing protein [Oscillospiraceae bacterium]|nr:UvrD-helicase domain-containing protein [Oscillospiraceae bacterium]
MSNVELKYNELKKRLINTLFANMNAQQQEAIGTLTGPLLILAGAGSGKTTVIVHRIVNMLNHGIDFSFKMPSFVTEELMQQIENEIKAKTLDLSQYNGVFGHKIKPWHILAITFTNKASKELKERIEKAAGQEAADVCAGTFHWFCLTVLHKYISRLDFSNGFTIYDADDSKRLLKNILAEQNVNEDMFNIKSVLAEISNAKDNLIMADDYAKAAEGNFRKSVIAKVYKAYQNELKNNNAVDFDDIILLTVKLFQQCPDVLEEYQERYKYIMVDEYQDTNYCQFVLIHMLAAKYNNICVVGDDDQSIYKFRGANIDNILNFEKHFKGAKTIRLEQNYRSTKTILNAANAVIANNQARKGKNLWTNNITGEKIQLFKANDEYKEAIFIAETIEDIIKTNNGNYNSCAVLYRTNAQSNVIETILARRNIPYRIFGGLRFYDRKEIKDILAYLNVIINKNDEVRLLRIINEPKRGIGATTIAQVKNVMQQTNQTFFQVISSADFKGQIKNASNLKAFATLINELELDLKSGGLTNIIDIIIEKTGYKKMLSQMGFEGESRLENIKELKSNMLAYMNQTEDEPTLAGFLNEISLYTDADNNTTDTDFVNLMTLHSAKGLEFEHVFISGMEEGIFPNNQALFDQKELEEERRLAYVGFTRAKKQLFLISTQKRTYLGKTNFSKDSRFIKEIPEDFYNVIETPATPQTQQINTAPKSYLKANKIQFDFNKNRSNIKFKHGDQVKHTKFGEGQILKATDSGEDQLLEVEFKDGAVKKLLANYANLSLIN